MNAFSPDTRISIHKDVVVQRLPGETILIHLDTDRSFVLNSTASRFWELCQQGLTLGEIRSTLLNEFDVPEGQLDQEIERVLLLLRAERITAE